MSDEHTLVGDPIFLPYHSHIIPSVAEATMRRQELKLTRTDKVGLRPAGQVEKIVDSGRLVARDKLTGITTEAKIFAPGYRTTFWDYYAIELVDEKGQSIKLTKSILAQTPMLKSGRITLFNVIVAMDWLPTPAQMNALGSAFRSASDLLQDVTNGHMALGQVVVGGPDWMGAADIQILASNRQSPRAGIRDFSKSDLPIAPVRLGRALWNGEMGLPVDWNEAEGYRVIIHEWMHYALGLDDLYISEVPLPAQTQQEGNIFLLIPFLNPTIHSIMAHLTGVSELGKDQYELIRARGDSPFEKLLPPGFQEDSGPHRLTMPLPRVYYVNSTDDDHGVSVLRDLPPGSERQPEGTWLYLLKVDEKENITALIAQGTLDHREAAAFELLGASVNNRLLAVREAADRAPRVWECKIKDIEADKSVSIDQWREVTPGGDWRITVTPTQTPYTSEGQLGYRYTFDIMVNSNTEPASVCYYPLGSPAAIRFEPIKSDQNATHWQYIECVDGKLDGYLVVTWGLAGALQRAVVSLSQGGPGGGNHTTDGLDGKAPGSVDGGLAIYFWEHRNERANGLETIAPLLDENGHPIRVITARSPRYDVTGETAYTVSATGPLPDSINATVVLFGNGLPPPPADGTPGEVWRVRVTDEKGIAICPDFEDPKGHFIAFNYPAENPLFPYKGELVRWFYARWVKYRLAV